MRLMYLPTGNFQRFVFYTNLKEGEEKRAKNNKNYYGYDAYAMAEAELEKLKTEDLKKENLDAALNMLGAMVANEREKEISFLKDKVFNNSNLPDSVKEELQKFDTNDFDYIHFTKLINNIYFENKLLLEKVEAERKRIERITEISSRGIKRYRGAYFKNMTEEKSSRESVRIKKEKGSYSLSDELLKGKKRNSVDEKRTPYLVKSDVRELSNLMRQREGDLHLSNLTKKNFSKIVKIINDVIKDTEGYRLLVASATNDKELEQLRNLIDLAILQYLNNIYAENISTSIADKQKSINSAFLETLYKDENYQTGKMPDGAEESIRTFVGQMENSLFDKELLEDLAKATYKNGGKDLILSHKEIKAKLHDDYGGLYTKKGNKSARFDEKFEKLQKPQQDEVNALIKQLEQPSTKKKPLTLKQGGKIWFQSEISAVIEQLATKNIIAAFHTGGSNNKDDFVAINLFYEFPEIEDTNREYYSKLAEVEKAIEKAIKNYSKHVIPNSSEMDAKKIHQRNEEILKASIKLQEQIDAQTEKLKEYLNETEKLTTEVFVEHGSVKDYGFFDDEIGFTSGALGHSVSSNGSAELFSALENIENMASLGGLTSIDVKRLAFAAINCADFLIGGEMRLKNPLENYLSMIAGALMFNDCELIMKEVNEKLKSNLPASVHQIHLYKLNGLYVPFSYVLQLTYEAMRDLNTEVYKYTNKGFHVQIINNYHWEDFSKQDITQETWRTAGAKAISNTTIRMTFLAGFADILDGLAKVLE